MGTFTRFMIVSLACCCLGLPAFCGWTVSRNSHFEVYSQAGAERGEAALEWFEELRSFFHENGGIVGDASVQSRPPIRVIGFSSTKQYDTFRLRMTADAYYVGAEDRDYIVIPALAPGTFGLAAHEYAHSVLYNDGLRLPPWLEEGVAEVFSTVRITSRRCEFGGPLPMRMETLQRHAWLPLSTLFSAGSDSTLRQTRDGSAIFYASSWALADMVLSSKEYAPGFNRFAAALNGGMPSQQAFATIYGKPLEAVQQDLQAWVRSGMSPRKAFPSVHPTHDRVTTAELSDSQTSMITAELLLASGSVSRAEAQYRSLLQQSPNDPDILAALGTVALRKKNKPAAVDWWRKAMEHRESNAELCYRFAVLADDVGLTADEIKRALQCAVASRPDFDDAHFQLALLENNTGDFQGAVDNLKMMANPSPKRAYSYWSTLAYGLSELGQREEAESAAQRALEFSTNEADRTHAQELAYVAKTDLQVRYVRNAKGELQLVTTRAPHGATDWNPFIEPSDHIQHEEGQLREVQCSNGRLTGFAIQTEKRTLALAVPDPTHVLMRNSPREFNCGPQKPMSVTVEYAGDRNDTGILRGMEFQAVGQSESENPKLTHKGAH